MNAPYFVEVMNQHHQVDSRYKFDALPIRIGRAYDNDLILDDAYVAPYHAEITQNEDGAISIRDLGSKNGVMQHQQRVTALALKGDDLLQLGHTQIRVRTVDFAVVAELEKNHAYAWDGVKAGLLGIAVIIASTPREHMAHCHRTKLYVYLFICDFNGVSDCVAMVWLLGICWPRDEWPSPLWSAFTDCRSRDYFDGYLGCD